MRPAPVSGARAMHAHARRALAAAQGGWRQWDVYLRDGTRVEANPLGAPDDAHLSISVGGYAGHDRTIPRARIDYLAAQTTVGPAREPTPGAPLPPVPAARPCDDVVVRRDGRRTTGRVTLARVEHSEGLVRQRDADIDLREIAYIRFARRPRTQCDQQTPPARRRSPHDD